MNLRKLRKEFGKGFEVSRDRRRGTVSITQRTQRTQREGEAPLKYEACEEAFSGEQGLAEYLKSKMPAMTVPL